MRLGARDFPDVHEIYAVENDAINDAIVDAIRQGVRP
jgi:hypothetical protein